MGFKTFSIATAGALLLCGNLQPAKAAGIPVYCWNCENASHNAANAMLDGLRSQTEALLNGADYVMRTSATLDAQRTAAAGATEQKIANSYAMEPSLGAKPRSACGQLGAASMRAVTASTAAPLRDVLADRTVAHNRAARNLSPGEPRDAYFEKQIITAFDDPDFDAGKTAISDTPISAADTGALDKSRKGLELLLNPFPVDTPSEEEITRIKASGSQGEKQRLAQTLALQRRQEVAQYVQDEAFERNIQRLDPGAIKYMINDISAYLSSDGKKMLEGNISPNQLDELMATYRVRSEEWVKQIQTSPSEAMARREQIAIQAEMLNQQWETKKVLEQLIRLLAMQESREVSQAGLQSR